ncbi:MAG: hypothetical protein ABI723_25820 [Bacteroidia bacterium]
MGIIFYILIDFYNFLSEFAPPIIRNIRMKNPPDSYREAIGIL